MWTSSPVGAVSCKKYSEHVSRASFFFFFLKFIYLFIYGCAQAFSSFGERGLLFVAVRRLLIAVASLVVEHGL